MKQNGRTSNEHSDNNGHSSVGNPNGSSGAGLRNLAGMNPLEGIGPPGGFMSVRRPMDHQQMQQAHVAPQHQQHPHPHPHQQHTMHQQPAPFYSYLPIESQDPLMFLRSFINTSASGNPNSAGQLPGQTLPTSFILQHPGAAPGGAAAPSQYLSLTPQHQTTTQQLQQSSHQHPQQPSHGQGLSAQQQPAGSSGSNLLYPIPFGGGVVGRTAPSTYVIGGYPPVSRLPTYSQSKTEGDDLSSNANFVMMPMAGGMQFATTHPGYGSSSSSSFQTSSPALSTTPLHLTAATTTVATPPPAAKKAAAPAAPAASPSKGKRGRKSPAPAVAPSSNLKSSGKKSKESAPKKKKPSSKSPPPLRQVVTRQKGKGFLARVDQKRRDLLLTGKWRSQELDYKTHSLRMPHKGTDEAKHRAALLRYQKRILAETDADNSERLIAAAFNISQGTLARWRAELNNPEITAGLDLSRSPSPSPGTSASSSSRSSSSAASSSPPADGYPNGSSDGASGGGGGGGSVLNSLPSHHYQQQHHHQQHQQQHGHGHGHGHGQHQHQQHQQHQHHQHHQLHQHPSFSTASNVHVSTGVDPALLRQKLLNHTKRTSPPSSEHASPSSPSSTSHNNLHYLNNPAYHGNSAASPLSSSCSSTSSSCSSVVIEATPSPSQQSLHPAHYYPVAVVSPSTSKDGNHSTSGYSFNAQHVLDGSF